MERLGVVGAGFMGTGIAESAAAAGIEVALYEPIEPQVAKSRERIANSLERAVSGGKRSSEEAEALLARITWSHELDSVADAELVIEAVVEDTEVKVKTFAELDRVVADDVVIASNTSSIPIAGLAAVDRAPRAGPGPALLLPGAGDEAGRGRGRDRNLR